MNQGICASLLSTGIFDTMTAQVCYSVDNCAVLLVHESMCIN